MHAVFEELSSLESVMIYCQRISSINYINAVFTYCVHLCYLYSLLTRHKKVNKQVIIKKIKNLKKK